MKRLVVNADDFGFNADVNEGILEAHRDGIVRSASLMANGSAAEEAARGAQRHPKLAVGCHLVLVQGASVACPGRPLPSSVPQLLASLPQREEIVGEFRAQVDKLLALGIRPTHLDTHKHLHLLPRVLDALTTVAEEYSILWIRKPFDVPLGGPPRLRSVAALAIRPLKRQFERRLRESQCLTVDYFAGFLTTGSLSSRRLASLLAAIPDGTGEFMCHPGVCGPELSRADTRLKESREAELEALCSPIVKRAVAANGIEIVSYRDLPTERAPA